MVRARDSIREILPVFSIQSALGTADSAPAIRPVAAASDLVRISSEKSRLDLPVPLFFFVARGGFQEKRGAASHGDYDEQGYWMGFFSLIPRASLALRGE